MEIERGQKKTEVKMGMNRNKWKSIETSENRHRKTELNGILRQ